MPDTQIDLEKVKQRMRGTWMAGDFGQIAQYSAKGAEEFVNRLAISPGMRVPSPVARAIWPYRQRAAVRRLLVSILHQTYWSRLAREPLGRVCQQLSKKATQSNYLIQMRSSIS
jgi:hypothetical protein